MYKKETQETQETQYIKYFIMMIDIIDAVAALTDCFQTKILLYTLNKQCHQTFIQQRIRLLKCNQRCILEKLLRARNVERFKSAREQEHFMLCGSNNGYDFRDGCILHYEKIKWFDHQRVYNNDTWASINIHYEKCYAYTELNNWIPFEVPSSLGPWSHVVVHKERADNLCVCYEKPVCML